MTLFISADFFLPRCLFLYFLGIVVDGAKAAAKTSIGNSNGATATIYERFKAKDINADLDSVLHLRYYIDSTPLSP